MGACNYDAISTKRSSVRGQNCYYLHSHPCYGSPLLTMHCRRGHCHAPLLERRTFTNPKSHNYSMQPSTLLEANSHYNDRYAKV